MVVDVWRDAPEGAEFYASDSPHWYKTHAGNGFFWDGDAWVLSKFSASEIKSDKRFTPRPAPEWPSDNRIDVIGQNGPSGEHYQPRIILDGIAQRQSPVNKYDRVIHGKYGGGAVTVDVYRVLNAFGPLSPEVQHAAKKLLAAGSRGHKDEKQDLLEAIQSIEARLKYLEDCNA